MIEIRARNSTFDLFIWILCFVTWHSYSQDQRVADSLKLVYSLEQLSEQDRLDVLSQLAYHENEDNQLRQSYAKELIRLAEKVNDTRKLITGYIQLGNSLRKRGDIPAAIDAYSKSLVIARETKNEEREGHVLMAIADAYSLMEDRENAALYYKNSLDLLRKTIGKPELGITLFNLGDELIKAGRFDEAIGYLDQAEIIFQELSLDQALVYVQGNRGIITGKSGNIPQGIVQIESAIKKLEEYGDNSAVSDFSIYLAGLYAEQGELNKAISIGERGLKIALEQDQKIGIRDSYNSLYQLYSTAGLKDKSIAALQNYYIYRDSITNIETVREIATLRYDTDIAQKEAEVELKQAEVDLLNQQRNNQRIVLWATGIVAFLLSFLAIGMFRKNKYVRKTNEIIDNERRRSEHLLLNILPEQTAQELKEKGKVKAKKFESATVLFTDFVDFTKYAEKLEPEKLVKGMDLYYGQFDKIMDKYGLEKIKTVGDSYMCAGGIPNTDPDHAVKMVHAALDIVAYVESIKEARVKGKTRFDIRVGINSGPIVAGVVGTKKFAYDIWGDTVNVAARMENRSEPGRVNISENTYALIKDHFDCEFRGEIEAKNKGRLKMYFVKGETGSDIPRPIQAKTIKQKETPV